MILNDALIPHYDCVTIPLHELKGKVRLSQKYLKEKSTWYMVNGKLKYFKIRNDYRLFTEQFFSKFGKQVLGLDTLEYQIASVRAFREEDPMGPSSTNIGLLSDNFQDSNYNYYLVEEMMNSEVSDLKGYGYSLSGMLNYFRDILDDVSYKKCKEFLIALFVADSFTMQMDRNAYNIGFQIPRIPDLSYTRRLRTDNLIGMPDSEKYVQIDKNGLARLKGFVPSKVYDNERILGVDHKNVLLFKPGDVWTPIWPYQKELMFETQEQARASMDGDYFGLDPNLAELFFHHPECKPLLERLAYDDEYRKIFEEFKNSKGQVELQSSTQEYFEKVLQERREEIRKVLSF